MTEVLNFPEILDAFVIADPVNDYGLVDMVFICTVQTEDGRVIQTANVVNGNEDHYRALADEIRGKRVKTFSIKVHRDEPFPKYVSHTL